MRTLIYSVAAFLLVGCATVTRGPMQNIRVGSRPAGATVHFSECGGTTSTKTPDTVSVNRGATRCTLTFSHPDHGTRTVVLRRKGHMFGETGPPDDLVNANEAVSSVGELSETAGALVSLPVLLADTMWVSSRVVDAISGAQYEQYPSTVLVDFTEPTAKFAGRTELKRR